MIRIPFLDGWTVGPKLGAFEAVTEGTAPQPVTLPHDAIRDLERSADSPQGVHAGYYPGGVFEYAKTFDVPEEWRDRTVELEFEGVYRDAVVYRQRRLRRARAERLRGFTVALDPFLRYGRPTGHRRGALAQGQPLVHGCGHLPAGAPGRRDPVHIPLDGVRVTTPDIDGERAIVAVATTARNTTRHTRTARIRWSVLDATERGRRGLRAAHGAAR